MSTASGKHGMLASMSRPGNGYDNASCGSFMKTLKWKEIYANDCRNLEPLVENVETFIEHYYSRCRLHSFFESSSFFALMRLVCVSFEPWTVKPGGKGSFCWRVNSTRKLYFSVNPLLSMIGR